MDKVSVLRSMECFCNLNNEIILEISKSAKLFNLQTGNILYYEGELLDSAFFLHNGCIEVYKMNYLDKEHFLFYVDDKLCDKRIINTFCTLKPYISCANARALQNSVIISIEFSKIQTLSKKYIELSNVFLSETLNKISTLKNIINFQNMLDSTTKVAYILLNDLARFNRTQRQMIARELNMQTETLSRILQKMFSQKLIDKDNFGNVYIKNISSFNEAFKSIVE